MGMNPDLGRPEMYLWQNIAVPPVCIRPSVQQDDTSNEDDITVKLTEVIFTNAHMQAGLNQGIAIHNLMVSADSLVVFPRLVKQLDQKASIDTYCCH
jgi:DNA-directed RNA polymerase III subunit RPC1